MNECTNRKKSCNAVVMLHCDEKRKKDKKSQHNLPPLHDVLMCWHTSSCAPLFSCHCLGAGSDSYNLPHDFVPVDFDSKLAVFVLRICRRAVEVHPFDINSDLCAVLS